MKEPRQPASEPELGRAAGLGVSWSMAASTWAKAASFAAQVVLGYLLSEGDWGVYAIAISLAGLLMAMRNGGAYELLVQRGPSEYARLRGPVFWMSAAFNCTIALILALGAPRAAEFYGEPAMAPILWVLAVSVVLSSPALFLRARLRAELRFGILARIAVLSTTLQYGGAIAFAAYGYGPLSFVLPLPLIAVVELITLSLVTMDSPWRSRPELSGWRELLGDVKWLLFGTIANVVMTMGDYIVLGRLVATEIVGVYYFAFQLSTHASMLAAASIATVLLPTLARLRNDPERGRRANLKALRSMILVITPMALGLASVIGPLEEVVWGGRWSGAVAPVQIICAMLPVRLTYILVSTSLKAQGRFRYWALITLGQALGVVAIAALAGLLGFNATEIAAMISSYFLVASVVILRLALGGFRVELAEILASVTPAWLIGLSAAAGAIAFGELSTGAPAAFRAAAMGLTFLLAYSAACRLLIPSHLTDLISVVPQTLAVVARRLLRFRSS